MISNGPSVLVIVPAYNEEGAVGHVVKSVREVVGDTPIAVIDDGSQDATAEAAAAAGAEVFRLPHHLGLGGAVQTGYRFAFEQGFDRVVRVDGDGQHNPSDIPTLLKAMDEGGYDVVTGSRYLRPNHDPIQPLRRFGSWIFSWVLYPILGRRITDPTSGFVAVNRRALEVFSRSFPLEYPDMGYPLDSGDPNILWLGSRGLSVPVGDDRSIRRWVHGDCLLHKAVEEFSPAA